MLVFTSLNLPIFIIAQINLYQQGVEIFKQPSFYSWLATSISVFFVYGISRSKHYHIGAWLFASVIFLTTNFVVLFQGETDSVVGYLITVLIVSIWFDARATSIFTGLSIILTIYASVNTPPISPASPAATIISCALLLVFVNHRNRIEEDRQAELSKVNKRLRKSESKLKSSQAVAHMGDWTWDIGNNTIKWSDEMYRIYGLNPEELSDDLSATLLQIVHPDDRAKISESSKMVKNGKCPEPFSYRVVRPDGLVRWIWTQLGDVEFDDKGEVTQLTGIIQDISERRQAEQTLAQTASLLTNVINTSSDHIFVKDTKLRIILANTSFAASVGKTAEELYGKTDLENGWDYELVYGNPEKGIRGFENDDREALSDKIVYNPVSPVIINGEIQYFDTTKTPLRDEAGEVIGLLGIARNITRHRQMEDRLKKQQELLQQMMDLNPNVVIVKDHQGRFVYANHAAEKQLGLRADEMIGKTDLDIHPVAPEAEAFMRDDQEVLETLQHKFIPQEPVTYANGELHWHQTTKVPLINSDGQRHIMIVSADITGLKLAEERLYQSEEQLNGFFHASPAGLSIVDNQLRYLRVNEAVAKIKGIAIEDHPGKTIREIVPELAPTIEPLFQAVFDTGESILNLEVSGRVPKDPDDQRHWISSYFPVTASDGTVRAVGVVVIDITERKQAEEILIYQASLLETISDAVVASDLDYTIKSWNPGAERLYGWSAQEVIGKNATELLKTQELDDQTFIDGKWHGEVIHTRKDGKEIHMWVSTAIVPDKDDQAIGLVAVGRDISKRKLEEEIRQKNEIRLAAYFENASQGILVTDHHGQIVETNEKLSGLFGYQRDELIGQSIEILIPGDMRIDHRQYLDDYMQAPKNRQMGMGLDLIGRHQNGTTFPIDISLSYIGKQKQILAFINDISERNLAEKQKFELAIQHDRIELLEEIISDLSHDIKTPLSIIMNNLFMLRKKEAVSKPHERHLDKIERQAQRLNKLVGDILTMARLDKGATLLFAPLNLNSLIENVSNLYYERAEEKKINLDFDLDTDLPSTHGNESEMNRVFSNLIENAIHYTSSDNTVTIRTYTLDSEIIVEIEDKGNGISDADIDHIFERFYRADKARRSNQGGTGLGLAITKKIVELHGGKIEVESILAEGSTFKIQLPIELNK